MVYKNMFSNIKDFKYAGITFKVQTTVHRFGNAGCVRIEVLTEEGESVDFIQLYDESGIETATEILKQSVYNYVDEHMDNLDKLFVKLNDGGEF